MWSLGCILGELISFSDPYRTKKSVKAGLAIFKGNSCFPMSPCEQMLQSKNKDSQTIISKHDQLNVILGSVGTQSDEDLKFIED